ncbi:MAG: thiol protease/hemagglutinin PrtT [Bacteroidota bacterium]
MKRFLISIAILLITVWSWGKPVNRTQALEIAINFMQAHGFAENHSAGEVTEYRLPGGELAYYVVSLKPAGWILVSADDILKPVIGYSPDSQWQPRELWPENKKDWMSGYEKQIERSLQLADQLPENREWKELATGSARKSTEAQVDPIIKVKWDQGGGWNRFCPEDQDGPSGHTYVGCVAVAQAQAMSVYQYPSKGTGTASYIHNTYGSVSVNFDMQEPYDWDQMSLSSSDDYNAKLLYHCAVTVDMDFGPDGSGAQTSKCAGSLKTYFNYSATAKSVGRYENEQEWIELLTNELLAGRPIIYSGNPGDGTAGHAFNIDGVGGEYFHLNWGWSGAYNDWYTINTLSPGSYSFNANQAAIVGIRPPDAGPYDIEISNTSIDEGLEPGAFIGKVTILDEMEGNVYDIVCKGPFNLFIGEEGGYGPSEFYIENDSLKTLTTLEYDDGTNRFLRIEVSDTAGNFYFEEFNISLNEVVQNTTGLSLHSAGLPLLSPNPASGMVRIDTRGEIPSGSLEIYSVTGQLILQRPFADELELNTGELQAGSYIVLVSDGLNRIYDHLLVVH